MGWEPVALIIVCYALGCLNAGYYVVRWRTGADIRTLGTGTAGARNVGRQLGKSGFAVTLLLDLMKGVVSVALARWLVPGSGLEIVATLAVVAGHIWPVQLGFRGGKGLATATGAMLIFDPLLLFCVAIVVGVLVAVVRRVTVPGLVGVASAPLIGIAVGLSWLVVLGVAAVSALVLFAHRNNIQQLVGAGGSRQPASTALSSALNGEPEG